MHVCTAVAKRELARARLLAESLAEHQPDAGFSVLVTDDVAASVRDEGFPTLRPDQIGVDCLHVLYAGCGPRTLALALRPWLLARLLDAAESGGPVVWLCPEARVYAPLEGLEGLCARHHAVATPGEERVVAVTEGPQARELLTDWVGRVCEGAARAG